MEQRGERGSNTIIGWGDKMGGVIERGDPYSKVAGTERCGCGQGGLLGYCLVMPLLYFIERLMDAQASVSTEVVLAAL
ncbi:hypothetical protein [Paenibacillus alkaliterrae]|uniref:hypothetical protein n=2 Tax=Paenibacillus alkaliterrae TaxID=320909 RepID=UPI001F27CEFA|nr:hypothetical protein [Paenibacillus alkaliterrae]